MKTLLFATGNAGKMKEIREILADLPIRVISLKEAGISPEIDENGSTFEENAAIKAETTAAWLKQHPEAAPGLDRGSLIVAADDSGLEIDALGGEPGVHSARFMGEDTSYRIKNAALLEKLEGVLEEKRTARFVCVMAVSLPDGKRLSVKGTIEGKIGYEERGENGFGYDPIFYLPDLSVSTAELPPEEKNRISHRGKALRKLYRELAQYLSKQAFRRPEKSH